MILRSEQLFCNCADLARNINVGFSLELARPVSVPGCRRIFILIVMIDPHVVVPLCPLTLITSLMSEKIVDTALKLKFRLN